MQQTLTLIDKFLEHVDKDRKIYELESGKESSLKSLFLNARARGYDFYDYDQSIITVILPNSIKYVEYLLAVLMTNNIFNPIPYFTSVEELGKILTYVDSSIIITDRKDIKDLFYGQYQVISVSEIDLTKSIEPKTIDPEKPASLYYSSGTTSNPKGVLYSHKNMVSLIHSIIRGFGFRTEDHQLAFLPFGHTAAINYNILPSLMVGCNLYISLGFDSLRSKFFEVLEKYQINYTEIVPTVLLMLLKLNVNISNYNLKALRYIGCGSSTLPLVSQKQFRTKYNIKVANLYGLSETGPSHIDDPLKPGWKEGSIGVPLDVNECKISEDGEILLKGDNVFIGYYKNESLYQEVIKDGWFHTGDLGEERDGKYFFVDRKKDLIIKGGINIVPMEVEEVLYKHPNVHECVVIGEKSDLYGEDVVAVVVLKSEVKENYLSHDLKAFCKQYLSNYKVPSRILIWNEIPKTHSNKLLRRKVRNAINI